jgi:hypothetical protein
MYTVKKACHFPYPSRDVTNQNVNLFYSVGGEAVWEAANKAFFIIMGAHLEKLPVPMHIAYLIYDFRNF